MTPPVGIPLTDSDPNLPAQPELSPEEIAREANNPASELSVKLAVQGHATGCPTARKVRRWTMLAAVLWGIVLATQAFIVVAGKAVLHETVRQAVREELGRPVAATPSHWMPQAHAEAKGSP